MERPSTTKRGAPFGNEAPRFSDSVARDRLFGEDFLLIGQSLIELLLIRFDLLLIGLDVFLIGGDGGLILQNRALILQNRFLVGEDFVGGHQNSLVNSVARNYRAPFPFPQAVTSLQSTLECRIALLDEIDERRIVDFER
jgi:hypothetical protein